MVCNSQFCSAWVVKYDENNDDDGGYLDLNIITWDIMMCSAVGIVNAVRPSICDSFSISVILELYICAPLCVYCYQVIIYLVSYMTVLLLIHSLNRSSIETARFLCLCLSRPSSLTTRHITRIWLCDQLLFDCIWSPHILLAARASFQPNGPTNTQTSARTHTVTSTAVYDFSRLRWCWVSLFALSFSATFFLFRLSFIHFQLYFSVADPTVLVPQK